MLRTNERRSERGWRSGWRTTLLLAAMILGACSRDDDDPRLTVGFGPTSTDAVEAAGTVALEVRLSRAAQEDVEIPFTLGGDARVPDDYAPVSFVVLVPAGRQTGELVLTIVGDVLDELDEQVVVVLGQPSSGTLGSNSSTTVVILDDDPSPSLAFLAVGGASEEGVGVVQVELELSTVSGRDVMVPFRTSGTADDCTDFTLPSSPLLLPAGETIATLSFTPVDDALDEDDETVTILLDPPVGATLGAFDRHERTLLDDDPLPFVGFTAALQEGDEAAGTVVFELALSEVSGRPVTIPFTLEGSASSGQDYSAPASPLAIPAGATSVELPLAITQDADDETQEDVWIVLGAPTNAAVGPAPVARFVLLDDDVTLVSSAELVEALHQIAPFVSAHALETTSGGATLAAASTRADAPGGTIGLASGLGEDHGLGDTDFGGDGAADRTVFEMTIAVPPFAASLVFEAQFGSREVTGTGVWRQRDTARVELTPAGGGSDQVLVLGDPTTSFAPLSPRERHALPVQGGTSIVVRFVVQDERDGAFDSYLALSNVFFSERPPKPIPPEEEEDYGDEIVDDVVFDDTVHLGTGAFFLRKTLLARSGPALPFELTIRYHSTDDTSSPLGRGWTHSYHWTLEELPATGDVRVKEGDGSAAWFRREGDGYVPTFDGQLADLRRDEGGGWVFRTRECREVRFDAEGRPVALRDPDGAEGDELVLVHGPNGLETILDTVGETVSFTYDDRKRLVEVVRSDGPRATFTYAPYTMETRLVGIVAPGTDLVLTYTEEGLVESVRRYLQIPFLMNSFLGGRLVAQAFHEDLLPGETATLTFDGTRTTLANRHEGDVSVYEFDLDRCLSSWMDPVGVRRTTTWAPSGGVEERTGPNGESRVVRNDAGKPVLYENQAGETTLFEYDLRCNLVRHVDPAGNESTFVWDPVTDRLLEKHDPRGGTVTYTYSPSGFLQSVTDRRGNTTRYAYDEDGELATIDVEGGGGRTTFRYDDLGRLFEQEDPGGLVTAFGHDGETARILRTQGFAAEDTERRTPLFDTEFVYDDEGLLRAERDRLAGEDSPGTQYEYSPEGLVSRVIDPTLRANRFEYASGLLVEDYLEGGPKTTRYRYDANRRLERVEDRHRETGALLAQATATWDDSGNKKTQTDPNGNTTTFGHDPMGRLTKVTDALGNSVVEVFDKLGRPSLRTNGRGQELLYDYGPNGQLRELGFEGRSIAHELDPGDLPVESQDSEFALPIVRHFDALGRMLERTDPFGQTIEYDFDAVGNLKSLTYPNGDTVRYEYDVLSRLLEVWDWDERLIVSYSYDAVGNLERASFLDGSSVEYVFDDAQRLLEQIDRSADGQIIHRVRYTLDALGRRQEAEVELPLTPSYPPSTRALEYGPDNRLLAYGDFEGFAYDEDGNMTAGTLDGSSPATLSYDALNRLTAVDGDVFRYDADGLRVEATRSGTTTQFVQDPSGALSRLLEEHVEGRRVARHLYGLGLVASLDAAGNLRVYHYDPRGSTVALTDESGAITDRFAYDPYGRLVARQGSTSTPFTYNGRDGAVDDGNGLYFLRARSYSPLLMRFVQRDAVTNGSLDRTQSLNRYVYVEGDPIHQVDPGGEWGFLGGLIGAAVNATISIATHVATGGSLDDIPWDEVARDAASGFISGFLGWPLGDLAANAFENYLDGDPLLEGVLQAVAVGAVGNGAGSKATRMTRKIPLDRVSPSQIKSLAKNEKFQRSLRKVMEKNAKGASYSKGGAAANRWELEHAKTFLARRVSLGGLGGELVEEGVGATVSSVLELILDSVGADLDSWLKEIVDPGGDDQAKDCFCEPVDPTQRKVTNR